MALRLLRRSDPASRRVLGPARIVPRAEREGANLAGTPGQDLGAVAEMLGRYHYFRYRLGRVLKDNRLGGYIICVGMTTQVLAIRYRLYASSRAEVERALRLDHAIAHGLGVDSVRVGQVEGDIVVEIPCGAAPRVRLANMRAWVGRQARGLRIPIGLDVWGRPVLVDFASDATPHALVVGASGAGKSELLATLIHGLAHQNSPQRLRVLLVDTRRAEPLARFERLAHLIFAPARTPEEALAACQWAIAELEAREREGRTEPAFFLIIDETFDIISRVGEVAEPLARLASGGRALGVHLILATQRVTKETMLTPMIQGNMLLRLVGLVANAQDSALATTRPGAGADKLLGRGDFLAIGPTGPIVRFQAALVDGDMALPSRELPRLVVERAGPKRWGGQNRIADEELYRIGLVDWWRTHPDGTIREAKRLFHKGDRAVKRARELAREGNDGTQANL